MIDFRPDPVDCESADRLLCRPANDYFTTGSLSPSPPTLEVHHRSSRVFAAMSRSECFIGVDYGTVRIGIACADSQLRIATPYDNYTRRGAEADKSYFQELAKRENVVCFVVGLPVHLSGDESHKSFEAREFGQWLREATGVEVHYFDERFTTAFARQLLEEAGLTKKKRKARLDKLAAQILLAAYLERGADNDGPPLGLDDVP